MKNCLCITAKLIAERPRRVNRVVSGRRGRPVSVRYAPNTDRKFNRSACVEAGQNRL
jgi:hypothetical protein